MRIEMFHGGFHNDKTIIQKGGANCSRKGPLWDLQPDHDGAGRGVLFCRDGYNCRKNSTRINSWRQTQWPASQGAAGEIVSDIYNFPAQHLKILFYELPLTNGSSLSLYPDNIIRKGKGIYWFFQATAVTFLLISMGSTWWLPPKPSVWQEHPAACSVNEHVPGPVLKWASLEKSHLPNRVICYSHCFNPSVYTSLNQYIYL